MHRLAFHFVPRMALWALVRVLRPLRFALGLSRRVDRPLEVLLEL